MMLLSLGLLTAGVAPGAFTHTVAQNDVGQTEPRVKTAEMSVKQAPVGDDDSVLELPDSQSVTMHNLEKEHESCGENSAA